MNIPFSTPGQVVSIDGKKQRFQDAYLRHILVCVITSGNEFESTYGITVKRFICISIDFY